MVVSASLRLIVNLRFAHPGSQDMRHGSGILLGLLADMLGQHLGLLGYGRKFQGVQSFRLLFLARAACSASWFSICVLRLSPVVVPSCGPSRTGSTRLRPRSLKTTNEQRQQNGHANSHPHQHELVLRACSYQRRAAPEAGLDAGGTVPDSAWLRTAGSPPLIGLPARPKTRSRPPPDRESL